MNPLVYQLTAAALITYAVIIKIYSLHWGVYFHKPTCIFHDRLFRAYLPRSELLRMNGGLSFPLLVSSPLHTLPPGYHLSSLSTLPTLRPPPSPP